MAFNTEQELVELLKESSYIQDLTIPGHSLVQEEVKGFFGIPDLIVVKKTSKKQISYAYEAKLTNWRRALTQAFRYKAFVNKSYVILDHDRVKPALSHTDKFCRANIGLMSIDNYGTVHTHYSPYNEEPFSPQLELKFNTMVTDTINNRGFS